VRLSLPSVMTQLGSEGLKRGAVQKVDVMHTPFILHLIVSLLVSSRRNEFLKQTGGMDE